MIGASPKASKLVLSDSRQGIYINRPCTPLDKQNHFMGSYTGQGNSSVVSLSTPCPSTSLARPGTSSSRPGTSSSRPGTSSGKKNTTSEFRRYFDRNELPLIVHSLGNDLEWKVEVETLDIQHYLPIFFSGLMEMEAQYHNSATEAILELLEYETNGVRLLAILPQLVQHIKTGLNTRDSRIIDGVLRVLQQMLVCNGVGVALIDYYRQILPICNILKDKHLGSKESKINDLVWETLEMMELYGTSESLEHIQHFVPSYQTALSHHN